MTTPMRLPVKLSLIACVPVGGRSKSLLYSRAHLLCMPASRTYWQWKRSCARRMLYPSSSARARSTISPNSRHIVSDDNICVSVPLPQWMVTRRLVRLRQLRRCAKQVGRQSFPPTILRRRGLGLPRFERVGEFGIYFVKKRRTVVSQEYPVKTMCRILEVPESGGLVVSRRRPGCALSDGGRVGD